MGTAESMGGLSIICDGRAEENNTAASQRAIPFIDLNHRNLADNKFGVSLSLSLRRRRQISRI